MNQKPVPMIFQYLKDKVPAELWKRYKKVLVTYLTRKKQITESNLTDKEYFLRILYSDCKAMAEKSAYDEFRSYLLNAITAIHRNEYQSTWVAFLTDSYCKDKKGNPKYPKF
jgi:hypothetical protein